MHHTGVSRMEAMNPGSESSESGRRDHPPATGAGRACPMRQVAAMAGISNPYLSQIEHGLRAPSEAVLERQRHTGRATGNPASRNG